MSRDVERQSESERYIGPWTLTEALQARDADRVAALIRAGADVNDREEHEDDTPLMLAVESGRLDLVRLLAEAGADPNLPSFQWNSALLCAAHGSDPAIFDYLAPLTAPDKRQEAEAALARRGALKGKEGKPNRDLLKAVASGDVERARAALAAGANPNLLNREGQGALHLAACGGHAQLVRVLLQAGASPNLRDQAGAAPLYFTADAEVLRILLEAGADVNARNDCGSTALHRSAYLGDIAWARLFLDAGADLSVRSEKGETPLDQAIHQRHAEMILLLARRGADLHQPGPDGEPALMRARRSFFTPDAEDAFPRLKRALAAAGLVDERVEALAEAALRGEAGAVRELIETGVDVNGRADLEHLLGATALYCAAAVSQPEIAEILIGAGADLEAAVVFDDTVEPNRPRTLEERMRARPRGPLWLSACQLDTLRDATPLVTAARRGHSEVLRLLACAGADLERRKSPSSFTPLMIAVYYGHLAAAEALLQAGAEVNARLDASHYREPDKTALSIARVCGREDLIHLLQARGAVDAPD